MRTLDLSPLFRSTVGFDHLDKLFDTAFRESNRDMSYPPYNIIKDGADHYRIMVALAGFGEDDIDITVHDNLLTLKGQVGGDGKDVEYLHRGIAQRPFEHRFRLADHVEVAGARLVNGLLTIELQRVVPEALKPRKIAVNAKSGPRAIEGTVEKDADAA